MRIAWAPKSFWLRYCLQLNLFFPFNAQAGHLLDHCINEKKVFRIQTHTSTHPNTQTYTELVLFRML